MPSRTVFINVVRTTVRTLQQRFNHSYDQENKSTSLFSLVLFSTSFPKWHYPNTNGAADCGSCVVTFLETLRALRASPPLQNDVIFVFADGEENSDLGARAFVTQHPWAKEVKLALNFEATGNRGASVLYSANRNHLPMMAGFAHAAPFPLASSFASDFVRLFPQMRGGCDLEEYMGHQIPGLGFALEFRLTG